MKTPLYSFKKHLTALSVGIGGLLSAQITLEYTYPGYVIIAGDTCRMRPFSTLSAFNLSNGTTQYYAIYDNANQTKSYLRTYNTNHSVDKTITIFNSSNNYPGLLWAALVYGSFFYLSDKLFDTDNDLEFIMLLGGYCQAYGSTGILLLFDETNNAITVLDSANAYCNDTIGEAPLNVQLVNTSAGWKLISQVDSFVISPSNSYVHGGSITKIYSLPGSYPPQPVIVKENHTGTELANPYPNPTNKQITLPYQLPKGQSGTLTIYNMEGKVIKTYTIDSMFHDIILNTAELPKGMYLYSVESNGQKLGTKKFIVQ